MKFASVSFYYGCAARASLRVSQVFIQSFQFFGKLRFFSAQFRAAGYISENFFLFHKRVDFFIPFFQTGDGFFRFFQVIFQLSLAGLIFFLLLPGKFCLRRGRFRKFRLFFRGIDRSQLFLFFQIIIVISDIVDKAPVCQIQDPGCRLVDKIPVVGDIEHSSGIILESLLQDFFRYQIQVVGRLVQDQKIGF